MAPNAEAYSSTSQTASATAVNMRELTLVMPFFQNMSMLAEQQDVWMSYPAAVRSLLHVIVVDDCSPKGQRPGHKQLTARGLASLRLFRITKKVRWNWLACRNLGMEKATTDWVLMTDIDHVLPLETLTWILSGELDDRNVYRFSRVDAPHPWPYVLSDCAPYKFHPDTYLMTKAVFDEAGGYDERFSGCYGTSGEFRDRVLKVAKAHVRVAESMVRYPREVVSDASTSPSVYTRKGDPANDAELSARRVARDLIPGWQPLRLTFPCELVAEVSHTSKEVLCSVS